MGQPEPYPLTMDTPRDFTSVFFSFCCSPRRNGGARLIPPTHFRTRRIQRRTRIHVIPDESTRRTRATSITAAPRATYSPTDRHTVVCQRFEGELYQKTLHLLRLPMLSIFFLSFLTTFNFSFMPPTGSRLLLVDISRLGLVFTGLLTREGLRYVRVYSLGGCMGFPLKL